MKSKKGVGEALAMIPISDREFDIYGLSLPCGPNFDPCILKSAWKCHDRIGVGAVLHDPEEHHFGFVALRRQVDHRFIRTKQMDGLSREEDALVRLSEALKIGQPPEAMPPGEKSRPPLLKMGSKGSDENFKILTGTVTHYPALMTVGEVYLAMPKPDNNFVTDFQTDNFNARLWELYLIAAFREQGIEVSQDYPSPDCLIERGGAKCWVEAVTANPAGERIQGHAEPVSAPEDRAERLLGAPAARFAKTLRSKIQRQYDELPHVRDQPFALAIADYHAPGSMVWSREALPSYLYGIHIRVESGPDGQYADASAVDFLLGDDKIPAGLFRDPTMTNLSGVIFSNAATFSKFNRMGYLAGWRPKGLTMVREGSLYDRTPGALEPIPFKLDILSPEYEQLWPWGEAWCQELEVYHNPLATHPISFNLLPGATHWFEKDGELECSSMWKNSVLSSRTHVKMGS